MIPSRELINGNDRGPRTPARAASRFALTSLALRIRPQPLADMIHEGAEV
jgi:hypothetical protein